MSTRVVGKTSTYSRADWRVEGWPETQTFAHASHVTTQDGRAWVDWTGQLGAQIIGASVEMVTAVMKTCATGVLLPFDELEEAVAEQLCAAVGTEQLRWCKNGGDATAAAVRAARMATNRRVVLTNGYHGSHADLLPATPGKSGGVLAETRQSVRPCATPAELLYVLERGEDLAAVLIEPRTPEYPDWPLEEVRALCAHRGVCLIFDEVVTGFRYRYGSAVDVKPDLYCFGKAIANGFPLACVTGPASWMGLFASEVFCSSTAATERASLAACQWTLTHLQQSDYSWLRELGSVVQEQLGARVHGYPQRLRWRAAPSIVRHWRSTLAEHGVLVGLDWFPLFSMTVTDLLRTLDAISMLEPYEEL